MNKKRNEESLNLSEEILRNFELNEIPTQQIILKCLRLARILNDIEGVEWLKQESHGFEKNQEGKLTSKAWEAAARSGRCFFKQNEEFEELSEFAFTETIAVMETTILLSKQRMEVAHDPDIAISSHSGLSPRLPPDNKNERSMITQKVSEYTTKIEKVKARLYEYVLNINYELKFGNITEDIFTHKRSIVDLKLLEISPESIKKFISIYENLQSDNNEDWANAVHSCRRIIKEVADQLYPPSDEPIIKKGQDKPIKVGNEQYINRLVIYIENKSSSDKFTSVVGSHLKFIGERLDSIHEAANKGTHDNVTYEEAERYIIYTYLLLGDILSLEAA